VKRRRLDQKGFTLPEVVVVLGLTALFTGLIMYFGMSYWRYGYLLQEDLDTLVTRLDAQDFLRDHISTASGLITQNGLPDPNAENPDPMIAGDEYWVPIHAVPTTFNTGGTGTTPVLYYKRFSVDPSGAHIMNGTQPYEDEYVLYLNNPTKQLLVRTIANPGATNNKALTSCPPDIASASCPADKVVASDLAALTLGYFSRSGNPVDWTSIFDPINNEYIGPDYPSVEVAEFTLDLAKKPVFQKTDATQNRTVIRIALRNT